MIVQFHVLYWQPISWNTSYSCYFPRLYQTQTACMKANTKIWFSLVLSYCAHQENCIFRAYSQQTIELAYDHLTEEQCRNEIRSIVSDVSVCIVKSIILLVD